MTSRRDELKALLDQVPETCLDSIEGTLRHFIMENAALERLHVSEEMRKSSSGWSGYENGFRFGGQSFRHFDKGALLIRTLQFFGSNEIELTERLSFSSDRTKLMFSLAISSSGHTTQKLICIFPASAEKSV
jgi:hypothetical protein